MSDIDLSFPYRSTLSLMPLISYWEEALSDGNEIDGLLALRVIEQLNAAPELRKPIHDRELLQNHQSLIDLLMTVVFPPATIRRIFGAAITPYVLEPIFATPSYWEKIAFQGTGSFGSPATDPLTRYRNQVLFSCGCILEQCYGINLMKETSLLFHIPDQDTGLDRHYKTRINSRFVEVLPQQSLPEINQDRLRYLLNHMDAVDLWMDMFSPKNFEFRGLAFLQLMDVTEEEVLSRLTYDLLAKDAFLSDFKRKQIQQRLRTLFQVRDLQAGIMFWDDDNIEAILDKQPVWRELSLVTSGHCHISDSSVYQKVRQTGQTVIVDNLRDLENLSCLEDQLMEQEINNLVLAPLMVEDKMLGVLELGAPTQGALTALSAMKLNEILPLFSMSVKRSIEELDNQIQAVIKEKYTGVHPSVAWRFDHAALNIIHSPNPKTQAAERILFRQVHPLYAISDIRGSSIARNHSTQSDLIQQLSLAQQVIQEANYQHPNPVLETLNHRIQKQKDGIEETLNTGDEVAIIDLLQRDVNPVFQQLYNSSDSLKRIINLYYQAIDPEIGLIFKQRKAYEDSVSKINIALSRELDQLEMISQQIYPHYFAKKQTDGIEYDMYVGKEMVPDRNFTRLDVQNLRLWQLKTTCVLARLAAQIKPQLPVPMELAHLILVYHSPISIRFRLDEKRFDVNGAYDMQYEILKKRIDKAYIDQSTERLTQPGTVTIVYSRPKEAEEYYTYINYLQDKGYLDQEIEHYKVEALQGVKGLKALRINVNLFTPVAETITDVSKLFRINR